MRKKPSMNWMENIMKFESQKSSVMLEVRMSRDILHGSLTCPLLTNIPMR